MGFLIGLELDLAHDFEIFSSCGGFYPICPMLLKVTRVLVAANSPFSIDFANTYGDLAATQPECVFERE